MAMKIKDALYVAIEDKVTIVGKVFGKGNLETYKNKQKRTYFLITVAGSSGVCKIKVYKNSTDNIAMNRSYRFTDIVRKFGGFWAIGCSKISVWTPLEIPETMEQEAKHEDAVSKENSVQNSPRKLKDAISSVTTSEIGGKVVQVSPLKFVRNGELPLKFISLKDEDTTVKIALFKRDAETEYKQGDVVKISQVYRYKDTETLSTKTTATVEFVDPETIPVEIKHEDYLTDHDFGFDQNALEKDILPTSFEVLGIQKAVLYDSYDKIGCKKKKLINAKCPLCKEGGSSKYGFATLIIHHDEAEETYTLFLNDLQKLIEMPDDFPNKTLQMNISLIYYLIIYQ